MRRSCTHHYVWTLRIGKVLKSSCSKCGHSKTDMIRNLTNELAISIDETIKKLNRNDL